MDNFTEQLKKVLSAIWKFIQFILKYLLIGARHVLKFLNDKKHLYAIPLFYLLITSLIIFVAVQVYQNYIYEDVEDTYTMDFSNLDDVEEEPEYDFASYDFDGVHVVIDPGHGGYDPGAVSQSGLLEENIVFEYADALRDRLLESNAEVTLTRELEESSELDERGIEGDLFISLHSDTFEDPGIHGYTVHYAHDFQIEFAEAITDGMAVHSPMYERGIRENGYQVIWQIDYPGVLVELGYLSNPIDDYILSSYEYKHEIVEGLMLGISNYID
ncbi:N-acetylmuramoyl-L-alanine amidase family protein [Aliicoccus persicus]|uniref:N-acetylmuramoyl-L-alanine amidase n=1 Tax=Aliicoccus persicus TaxID=930138 RepID=A0A662Z3P6_9STAP|nr:N-acetylmuramoyl-L-alanine amidase [Aliicoccus persicus]SEV85779.1 N-acetylmuramoyl-L-alanine amidase [Aliicoccus persicus]HJE18983.1 N-acetylmuramoyl-L-alanine amidase [Aliicoccus persicus]